MKNPATARALPTAAAVLSTGALILAVLILNTAPGTHSSHEDAPAGSSSAFNVTDPARGLVNMHPALLQDAS